MEEEFRAILLAASGLISLVPASRINWGAHAQGAAFPAVILTTISDVEDHHMNGHGGLFDGRVQVDCYAVTYGQAKVVSRAVLDALHFYRAGGFFLITHLSTRDSREGGSNEADRPFRVSMDFQTAWRPT